MLNIFPIQFLAPLAYFFLRICVGIIFLSLGAQHLRNKNRNTLNMVSPSRNAVLFISTGIVELVTGFLFILGAYTQIAALSALLITSVHILRPNLLGYSGVPPRMFFVLLFFVALSLFITGAGVFAFDLPL
jgi:uncharacterized membrane protein YphA (DoxX/SURF4 family)